MAEKILAVEDNPQNLKLIQMTLKPYGYAVLSAVDGEKALEIAIREKPDLIIVNIQLPKMSGLQVTRSLRKMPGFSQTPIIAITAYAMKGDKEKAIEAGCDAYLSKPISTRELPELVAEMLLKRKQTSTEH